MDTAAALRALETAGLSEHARKVTGMGHKLDGQRFATVLAKVAAGALTIAGVRQCAEMGTL